MTGTILSTRDYGTNKKRPLWVERGRFGVYRQQTRKYTSGDDITSSVEKNRAGPLGSTRSGASGLSTG